VKSIVQEIIRTYLICLVLQIIFMTAENKWSWFSWRMEIIFLLIVAFLVLCERLVKKLFGKHREKNSTRIGDSPSGISQE